MGVGSAALTDRPCARRLERRLRRMDAAGSAWPAFVWRLFDYRRLRARLAEYFRTLQLGKRRC